MCLANAFRDDGVQLLVLGQHAGQERDVQRFVRRLETVSEGAGVDRGHLQPSS